MSVPPCYCTVYLRAYLCCVLFMETEITLVSRYIRSVTYHVCFQCFVRTMRTDTVAVILTVLQYVVYSTVHVIFTRFFNSEEISWAQFCQIPPSMSATTLWVVS